MLWPLTDSQRSALGVPRRISQESIRLRVRMEPAMYEGGSQVTCIGIVRWGECAIYLVVIQHRSGGMLESCLSPA